MYTYEQQLAIHTTYIRWMHYTYITYNNTFTRNGNSINHSVADEEYYIILIQLIPNKCLFKLGYLQ